MTPMKDDILDSELEHLPDPRVSEAILKELNTKINNLKRATVTISEQWNAAADNGEAQVTVSTQHLGYMLQMAYKYMGLQVHLIDTGVRDVKQS